MSFFFTFSNFDDEKIKLTSIIISESQFVLMVMFNLICQISC